MDGENTIVDEYIEEADLSTASLTFRLTPEEERVYLEELKVTNNSEWLLVVKLRKLLMMSLEKRILFKNIAHLKTDLGLHLDFQDTIWVVVTERRTTLEGLTIITAAPKAS